MKKLIIAAALALSWTSAQADSLNWTQEKELFVSGTVTDSTGRVWNVQVIPGTKNINHDAIQSAVAGKDLLAEMAKVPFWKERLDNITDGLKFSRDTLKDQFTSPWSGIRDGVDFSRDTVRDTWIKGIGEDYKDAKSDLANTDRKQIGGTFAPIWYWGKFGAEAIGRTIWMPIGVVGGVAYSAVSLVVNAGYTTVATVGGVAYAALVPVGFIVGQPIVAIGYDWGFRDVVVPPVMYVWNGFAWVGCSFGDVPTHSSGFVHLVPGTAPKTELVIDTVGFTTLVKASVAQSLETRQVNDINNKIHDIDVQIQNYVTPLKAKQDALANDRATAEQNLNQDQNVQGREQLQDKARSSDTVKMDKTASDMYLDGEKFKELIREYLVSIGIEKPSDELVKEVADRVTQNLKDMNAQMAQKMQQEAVKANKKD